MRDVPWGQQSIAGLKNKSLVSDGSLKFSGKDKVHFVLARMGMMGHRHPRRQAYLQQAIGSSCIGARQTYGTEAHIKVISFASWLMFD
jgi:hypothetical protein